MTNRPRKFYGFIVILSVTSAVTLMLVLSYLNRCGPARKPKGEPPTKGEQKNEPALKRERMSAASLVAALKNYSLKGDKLSEGYRLEDKEIYDPLKLDQKTIPFSVSLENCLFTGDVNFSYSVFQQGLSLRGSIFNGTANFYKLKVDGDFRFERATFTSKEKQINFDSMNVTGTFFFYDSVLAGPVTLSGATLNELECSRTQFNNSESQYIDEDGKPQPLLDENANFYNIKVNGNATFTDAAFEGSANFESADIAKTLEMSGVVFSNCHKNIKFGGIKVRDAYFNKTDKNKTTFAYGFDMSNAEVAGTLSFRETQASNFDGAKTFLGMKVDTAVFDQVNLSNYSLQGAEYRLFNPTSEDYCESLALINDSTYNHSSFTNLEAYYRRVGLEKAADDVYFHGKLRELKVVSWSGYFWNLFLLITVGYGKYPGIALLWSILFICIGRRCFRRQYMTSQSPSSSETKVGVAEEDKEKSSSPKTACLDNTPAKTDDLEGYNPWWYSIALFLPIVDLEDAKTFTIKGEHRWRRHYMRVHVILGYLLVPIGLAAWTGLIK